MAKYVECRYCGAHLDFDEKCDCVKELERYKKIWSDITAVDKHGQLYISVG